MTFRNYVHERELLRGNLSADSIFGEYDYLGKDCDPGSTQSTKVMSP
jgi:hypothetical protein